MKICSNCKYWVYSKNIAEIHGEGCGLCRKENIVTFCEHPCFDCDEIE